MPAEPHIRSPFPRTAGTTIPDSRGHRAREGGSTLYVGISQPLFGTVRPPGSNGADQALVELAIMLPVVPNASPCRHDRTGGDRTMAEVSREGDEQFAGQRDDRNAADPAALGANALVEPTAESTGRLVSHPHPGKLDHCGAQTPITGLRDTLFLVDAATLPWTGSQAGIGRQLPSVLKPAEQTLKVEHGSEFRANALEPHKECRGRARLCQLQHFIMRRPGTESSIAGHSLRRRSKRASISSTPQTAIHSAIVKKSSA